MNSGNKGPDTTDKELTSETGKTLDGTYIGKDDIFFRGNGSDLKAFIKELEKNHSEENSTIILGALENLDISHIPSSLFDRDLPEGGIIVIEAIAEIKMSFEDCLKAPNSQLPLLSRNNHHTRKSIEHANMSPERGGKLDTAGKKKRKKSNKKTAEARRANRSKKK